VTHLTFGLPVQIKTLVLAVVMERAFPFHRFAE